MAFEYGSDTLGIRNPFKFVGFVQAIRGLILTVLGVITLLSVSSLVQQGDKTSGWLSLLIGLLLLSQGVIALGSGLFKMMRFYVGRSVPASLAENVSPSEDSTREKYLHYQSQQLIQMLMGRKNLTFTEPKGWFARLILTLMPTLLFLPHLLRNKIQSLSGSLVYTLVGFLFFGLAWFSGSTGLTVITTTPVLDWLSLFLGLFLLIVWTTQSLGGQRKLNPTGPDSSLQDSGSKGVVWGITFSILTPVLLSYFHTEVTPLPKISFSTINYIITLTSLGVVVFGYSLLMTLLRAQKTDPKTEVSEFRENWQENVHPQDIFINFEDIIMANRRFKEIPNRVYRDFDPNLIEQGSDDKGKFSGEIIEETQPVFRPVEMSLLFKNLRIVGTVVGELLLLSAALMLYSGIHQITQISSAPMIALNAIIYPFLLWIFGRILAEVAFTFWSEMQYESLIVYFQCNGTYTESKISTGTSIHDSTRSENTIVRSSMTPWIVSAKIVTSSFATSGANNLEGYRSIMELHKAEQDLDKIVSELKDFMRNRETIANVKQKDLDSASSIYQVNKSTRSQNSLTPLLEEESLDLNASDRDY